MRKFFMGVWRVITFPFRLVFTIITFPFRTIYRFFVLINTEPEERPIADVFADIVTQKEVRDQLWEQIEAFRMHLLRSVVYLAIFVIAAFWVTEPLMAFLSEPVGGLEKLQAIQVTLTLKRIQNRIFRTEFEISTSQNSVTFGFLQN